MLNKLSILTVAVLLFSCGQKSKTTGETIAVAPVDETTVVEDIHNANNSLDYAGTYKGVLPCADCDGIETELTLDYQGNYVKKTKFLGKEESAAQEEKGTFTWDESGSTITLTGITGMPNQYFVGENQLFQLDMSGKMITGDQADKYILVK